MSVFLLNGWVRNKTLGGRADPSPGPYRYMRGMYERVPSEWMSKEQNSRGESGPFSWAPWTHEGVCSPRWMRYREPSRGINPRLTDHLLSVGYLYTVQLRQYNYKLYIISVQRIPETIYSILFSTRKMFLCVQLYTCVYNCTCFV